MQLLLEHHRASLLANGARTAHGEDIDPLPVVKLGKPYRAPVLLAAFASLLSKGTSGPRDIRCAFDFSRRR